MPGQLISRGDRKWLVRVFLGREASGRRRYHNHTVNGSKKDAQKYLTAAMRSRDLGILVEPARISLDAYLDRWLENGREAAPARANAP